MPDFTKGKWFHCWQNMKVGKRKRIEIVASVKVSEGAIKSIANISGSDTEAQANARLIAAAPDMYNNVKTLLHDIALNDENRVHGEIRELARIIDDIDGKDTRNDEQSSQ